MERTLILFFATLVVFGTAGVQAQFSYAPNITVNITRTGCGSTKLCVQIPDACDPAGSSGCLFGSSAAKNASANDFSFQLSGNIPNANTANAPTTNAPTTNATTTNATSTNANTTNATTTNATSTNATSTNATSTNATSTNATTTNATTTNATTTKAPTTNGSVTFVGLELSSATGPGLIFACIQNNSAFQFQTYMVNSTGNVTVTLFDRNVTQIRGLVNPTKIQCEFDVANLTTTSLLRSQNNAFYINLVSGILNGDRSLSINQIYSGGLLDLANPSANIANTTTAPNATVSSGPNQAFHSGGVLLLTGILSLAFLKTA